MEKNKKRRGASFFGLPLILPYVRPYLWTIIWMIILGILSSLADSVFPLFNNSWASITCMGAHAEAAGTFTLYLLLMVLAGAGQLLLSLPVRACGRCRSTVICAMPLSHPQTLSFSYFNQNSVGYIHAHHERYERIGELLAWRMMDVVWNVSYIIWRRQHALVINARLASMCCGHLHWHRSRSFIIRKKWSREAVRCVRSIPWDHRDLNSTRDHRDPPVSKPWHERM